jgi:hypothetical protein
MHKPTAVGPNQKTRLQQSNHNCASHTPSTTVLTRIELTSSECPLNVLTGVLLPSLNTWILRSRQQAANMLLLRQSMSSIVSADRL